MIKIEKPEGYLSDELVDTMLVSINQSLWRVESGSQTYTYGDSWMKSLKEAREWLLKVQD